LLGALAADLRRLRPHRRPDAAGRPRRDDNPPPDRLLRAAAGRNHDRPGDHRAVRNRVPDRGPRPRRRIRRAGSGAAGAPLPSAPPPSLSELARRPGAALRGDGARPRAIAGLRYIDPNQRRGRLYLAICRLSATRVGAWLSAKVAWKLDPHLLRLTRGRFSTGWPVTPGLLETRGARTGELRRT